MKLPGESTSPDSPTELFPTESAFLSPVEEDPDLMAGVDPFALWSASSDKPLTTPPTPEKFARRPTVRLAQAKPRSRREPAPAQFGRRKLLTLLAAGTAGVITVVTNELKITREHVRICTTRPELVSQQKARNTA
jgi:hypothetical protein